MPIMVHLIEDKYHYDKNDKLPAHDFVLKPLLENCIYSYVYELKSDSELYVNNKDILMREKGKYKLDTAKDCVSGREYFWNAAGWQRGSIAIILKNDTSLFDKIFKRAYNPSFLENPNTANTISAIKKCKEEMEKENIGVLLTASNGIEWMLIYAKQEILEKLFEMARKNCKIVDYGKQALKKLEETGIK